MSGDDLAMELSSACNEILSEEGPLDGRPKVDVASLLMWNIVVATLVNLTSNAIWEGVCAGLKTLEVRIVQARGNGEGRTASAAIAADAKRAVSDAASTFQSNAIRLAPQDLAGARDAALRVLEQENWPEANRRAAAEKLVSVISAQLSVSPAKA